MTGVQTCALPISLELIKNPSKTPFLDFEERDKLLAKIQTGFTEQGSLQNLDNLFLSGQGSTAVGAGIKNIDGKEITQKDLEKTANRFALTTNEDGSLKYNTAQVIEQANINNTKVPLYLETLDAGGNITDTSSKDATLSGLQLYQTFRSEEHTSELQSHSDLVCRLLLEKKKTKKNKKKNKKTTTLNKQPTETSK